MKKYKVKYSGFMYFEADSEEDARDKYDDGFDYVYDEHQIDDIEEVEDFEIML